MECDAETNCIHIFENYAEDINVHLNAKMVDFNRAIVVRYKGKVIFEEFVRPKLIDLWNGYQASGDDNRLFEVCLTVRGNERVYRYIH